MAEIRGALWRGEVEERVARLDAQADGFGTRFAENTDQAFFDEHVRQPLARADGLRARRQNPADWWSGALIEDAWRQIRHAEESLVALTPDLARLRQHAATALARAKNRLPHDDERVTAVRTAAAGKDADTLRVATVALLEVVNAESARRHQHQRGLRNRLRILTIGLAAAAVALMVVGLVWDGMPDGVAAVPDDITGGTWIAVAMVAGAVGAMFSAIPSLAMKDAAPSSFDTTAQQALLKVVIGAWSAPIGLVAVTAGVGTDPTGGTGDSSTLAGFLMMTALFGAAQEALTRFADNTAADAARGVA